MMDRKHYKILERIQGTKDKKTLGLIQILQEQGLKIEDYFISSSYKDTTNRTILCFQCTLDGVRMIIDYTSNYRNKYALLEWYNKKTNTTTNIILCDRQERYFMDELSEILAAMNIQYVLQYSILQYYIDMFLPEYNIAIEYDEGEHKSYSYEKQELRQNNIESVLECKFIRVSNKFSNLHNIGLILKQIMP